METKMEMETEIQLKRVNLLIHLLGTRCCPNIGGVRSISGQKINLEAVSFAENDQNTAQPKVMGPEGVNIGRISQISGSEKKGCVCSCLVECLPARVCM